MGINLKSFFRNEDGATLVEYGVAVLVAVAVGTLGVTFLGDEINDQLDVACDAMSLADDADGCVLD